MKKTLHKLTLFVSDSRRREPSILGLFQYGRPSTVLGRVIAVVVNAIYGGVFVSVFSKVQEIRFVHIISKVFKGFPTVAHSNTSATIVRKASLARHGSTAQHRGPLLIKMIVSICHTMSNKPSLVQLFSKAATASRLATNDLVLLLNGRLSAIALEYPKVVISLSMRFFERKEAPKAFTGYVNFLHI